VLVDYHMHLRGLPENGVEPLVHTREAIERYVERAAERGIAEIAFTEHVYYFVQTREIWRIPYHVERCVHDLDLYVDAVVAARRTGLPVKLGLEVDRVPGRQEALARLLQPYPWDVLLGSVHEVVDAAIDQAPGIWERLSVEEVWRDYVRSVVELARSGAVDVMAHPDLAKIYGQRPRDGVLAELHETLAAGLAAAGVAAEVSTAGLRKPVGEIYPGETLLAAFGRHGVPVTLASDAHEAHLVGEDFDRAVDHVRSAGYVSLAVFDGRSRREEPLG
jgi:histidinol-phosphatase (PHP family)